MASEILSPVNVWAGEGNVHILTAAATACDIRIKEVEVKWGCAVGMKAKLNVPDDDDPMICAFLLLKNEPVSARHHVFHAWY